MNGHPGGDAHTMRMIELCALSPGARVLDMGAGEGEVVMLVGGSSSRQTNVTENKPVDQSIVAIIDSVDVNGTRIFEKFNKES